IKKICHALLDWQSKVGKEKDFSLVSEIPAELFADIKEIVQNRLNEALAIKGKKERDTVISSLKEEVFKNLFPENSEAKYKSR
ncbi:hypothetical protein ACI3QN_13195, partial [Propionibacterium freudenreichii]|uniref:hypothetical protein n=1 Tax=Propionibacterium freudenreichii TaxID=1744 RepID=UPI003851C618